MSAAQSAGSRALVATGRAARYGKQLAAHLGRRLETGWDDDSASGLIRFDNGRCDLTCTDQGLLLQLHLDGDVTPSAAPEQLAAMEDVVGRHLVRFGARDELVTTWERSGLSS